MLKLYGMGSNYFGQLGLERSSIDGEETNSEPVELPLGSFLPEGDSLCQVHAGSNFSMIQTSQGHLFQFGSINGVLFPSPTKVFVPYTHTFTFPFFPSLSLSLSLFFTCNRCTQTCLYMH